MAYFDHFASNRTTNLGLWFANLSSRNVFRRIVAKTSLHKESSILEIGPGRGEIAKNFISNGFSAYDVMEPNRMMRDSLNTIGLRNVYEYKVPPINVDDNSFDLIIVSDVLEHMNDLNEATLLIKEINRKLKNNGSCFITSPDFMDWQKDFYNCDFSHNFVTSMRRIIQLLENEGLEVKHHAFTRAGFTSLLLHITGGIIKFFTFWSKGNTGISKLYKLRLTFLRRFEIIAKKHD